MNKTVKPNLHQTFFTDAADAADATDAADAADAVARTQVWIGSFQFPTQGDHKEFSMSLHGPVEVFPIRNV